MRIKRDRAAALRLLANPIAYRVLATIGGRGPQTTSMLGRALSDVPTSSLYRQLASLRKAGVLHVVAERQARGAVERTYALASRGAGAFAPSDVAAVPMSERRALLRNFLATMVADTTAYVESRAFARPRVSMSAGLVVRALTDEEYAAVVRAVSAALAPSKAKKPAKPARKRRYFYFLTIPEVPTP